MRKHADELEALSRKYVNLADARLGSQVILASDEFFAPKERLLEHADPIWVADKYDNHGKWMDGWETRRKRGQGHDYCVVRLAKPGTIKGVDIDTRYFTGNYAPVASLEGCLRNEDPDDTTEWAEILPPSSLEGDSHNLFQIVKDDVCNYLRLSIFPDGGVARLRVYGDIHIDWDALPSDRLIDVAALEYGGRVLECSDEHFGSANNLILPGRAASMRDGWETRRRREPGYDWVVMLLGHAAHIKRVDVDTTHFKGNFPDQVSMHGANLPNERDDRIASESLYWPELLPALPLKMHQQNLFERELKDVGPITHVRVNIHPDGGLSRVRLFGFICKE